MSLPRTLQDLAPRDAHRFLAVERFLHDDLQVDTTGRHFLIALSGGADSTALLLFAKTMSVRWQSKVTAAHVDHGLRPESREESRHVASLCAATGVELVHDRLPVEEHARTSGSGIEEAARDLRYAFLEQQRLLLQADWIMTGHHLNDLAEDVVLRLLRGTGWPGLSGMPALDDERCLLRPFLLTPKSELKDILTRHGVSWLEDPSNDCTRHLRNRIRHQVLPVLLEENPSFLSATAHLWTLGRIDAAYWRDQLQAHEADCAKQKDSLLLKRSQLANSSPALRLRLYKTILDGMGPGQVIASTLLKLDRAFTENEPNKSFQFPGDKVVQTLPQGLMFSHAPNPESRSWPEGE